MTARYTATGLNPTPKWLWVHFTDRRLAVPRPIAVQVHWGLVTDQWQNMGVQVDREFARRIEAMAQVAQLPLPLEKWE